MSRVRRRDDLGYAVLNLYSNGVLTGSTGLDSCTHLETFEDSLGGHTWHDCDHGKYTYLHGRVPDFRYSDPEFGGDTTYSFGGPHGFLPFVGDYRNGDLLSGPFLPPNIAASISRNAVKAFTTQIPFEVDIFNFLKELKNPKEALVPRIREWASHHTAADLLLWWKFGIEPTISDTKKLFGILGRVKRRLDFLRKVNKRTVTLHHSASVNWPVEPEIQEPYDWFLSGPSWSPRLRREYGRSKVTITAQVTYDLEGLDGVWAYWDSLAAALGLNNPLGIYWEGTTLSFVVDWFVNVGDWLEANNPGRDTFHGTIRVVSCGHSVRTRMLHGLYYATCPSGGWARSGGLLSDHYYRASGLPEGELDHTGLTPMQQLLGLALLDSRGVFSRRRRRSKSRLASAV